MIPENTKGNLLSTIEIIRSKLNIQEVQPKDIINFSSLSTQTIYSGLQELVQDKSLNKRSDGKFTYYSLTDKGIDSLIKYKELRHKSLIEPFIKNIANKLIEDHPEEFKDINYRIIVEYLFKNLNRRLRDLEDSASLEALKHFVNESNDAQ